MKWYELNPGRFEIEKRLLARYHPGSKLVIEGGRVKVTRQVVTHRDTYVVEGKFADDHPYSDMRWRVLKPTIRGSPPHRYDEGELCLHEPGETGPETTAKIYLDWATQWILTYERWRDGEQWPRTNQG
jgi:hypothetical protein